MFAVVGTSGTLWGKRKYEVTERTASATDQLKAVYYIDYTVL